MKSGGISGGKNSSKSKEEIQQPGANTMPKTHVIADTLSASTEGYSETTVSVTTSENSESMLSDTSSELVTSEYYDDVSTDVSSITEEERTFLGDEGYVGVDSEGYSDVMVIRLLLFFSANRFASRFGGKSGVIFASDGREFSVLSEEITKLKLSGTAITSLSSISSLSKLTYLDLSYCTEIEILYLQSKSLKTLIIKGCLSLSNISITSDHLTKLNLDGVSKLESLNVNARSLVDLYLLHRSSLKEFSVVSEEITALDLSGSAISSFSSITSLPKLTHLALSYCREIEILDLRSKSLGILKLKGCSSLTKISITSYHLTESNIVGVSKLERINVNARCLVDLYLHYRSFLKEISVVSEEITALGLSDSAITSFSSTSSLPKLTHLDLSYCKEIERLEFYSKSLIINSRVVHLWKKSQ
ncbi:hypothetical protein Fmac_025555 [Flemingia macrophylla]|uniref:Uncharacterized protein n=1 Tax=Flemingia macrophylla TaxID=520843 RepID=A0ABD1LSK3_9FABA